MSSSVTEIDHGRSDRGCSKTIKASHHIDLELEPHEIAALDLWIAMNPMIHLSRDQAIKMILTRVILKQL